MALTDIVNVGDKLNVKIVSDQNRTGKSKVYVSQVLDIKNSSEILISLPIEAGRIVPLMLDIRYNLCFYTKSGLFQCDCILTKRYQINNIYVGEAQITTSLEKFQRREYYRIDCLIDTKYTILADNNDNINSQLESTNEDIVAPQDNNKEVKNLSGKEPTNLAKSYERLIYDMDDCVYDAVITNLSGGGARFKSKEVHQNTEYVILKVILQFSGNEERYYIKSRIIAATQIENIPGYYEYRVVFEDISKFVREKIIKYIFDVDRRKQYHNKRNG
ncbi:MAG TPA: flagellar brake protein [Lachnospiraceae bacterium]|nr:flagellar brake protein [Lachnospiraceae bacterium]